MIIYNETIVMDEGIQEEWLAWMKAVHIPNVMATGHFYAHQILTVLDSPNEGVTYCVQYQTDLPDNFKDFHDNRMQGLQLAHQQKFENKFVLFTTLMQTVE